MYQFNFDLDQFLAEFWQKKPTIIRNGFANFEDPISPDELAGLAMEEEIDSRFVSNATGKWEVQHGPFDTFEYFPDTESQLIVQASNHWHPGPRALSAPFNKLPNWLFDDVMTCLSMPGGGVGPHIDQYDVFIIQGMGKRRWRVGPQGEYEDANHESGLRQITGFDAIIDEELNPGDIIYIPPGFPHEGNTSEVSLSYSIGYRSPKKRELLSSFADFVISNDQGDVHYHQPALKARDKSGMVSATDKDELNEMLMSLLTDDEIKSRWLGELLSQSRHELDIMPAEPPWQMAELTEFVSDNLVLERVAGLKALYHQENPSLIFINGDTYELNDENAPLISHLLCNLESFTGSDMGKLAENPAFMDLLLMLCNQGYWYPQA
ncbi:50S ribosomal protein L16 arginine hydroxylase [Veronia nyctiphanis]|uniref:50S ribosomal protein L16 arginine hydroxylase n=1 Tax=Veronia nyctiphanis TaxID=1278244 RepID=A0A4Q0YTV2_9GAMM|nr:cupin domain-containing protein [Veronia nyctiphanis]RXJ73544.1 50S ribosomal protein L16 arginine hydroxylase [Veronia nyctiphanis]